MDRLLEEKKKSQANFRLKINDFITKSPYARKHNQLTNNILSEILTTCPLFEGITHNGKVNLEKLCQKVVACDPHLTSKDLMKVLGGKKEMKVSQLHQLLKSYQLHEFDLEEQINHMLFDGDSLSLNKLDEVMESLNMAGLTPKDRELLIECFDFDHDGSIKGSDLMDLLQLCKGGDEHKVTLFRQ